MSKEISPTQNIQSNLESIKKIKDGLEFWSARELMGILGYSKWQVFREVIQKAEASCAKSGYVVSDHVTGVRNMITVGKGAQREMEDFLFTRYACYLIAQNGDSRKPEIALSQTYFAVQTRKQELTDVREYEDKRLESRKKLKETEGKIESTVYERGIKFPVEFGSFKNKHIEALYGGLSVSDLKKKRNIPSKRALADFDTEIELKAKDFSLAITDHNIKKHNIQGKNNMTEEVIKNSKATRKTLLSRGIKPEALQAEEDLKKVEGRRKEELGDRKVFRIKGK
jgi:DNA-damage-inducible protein D